MKVLFITQEIVPFLPETDMSMISRHLPQGIQEQGKEIRTFTPKFGCISERRNQLHEVIRLSGMNLIISDTDHPLILKVASIQSARMQIYFIDNDDYFSRKYMFCDDNKEYFPDNDERVIFFTRGVLETVRKLRWQPNIVHCHGWFTGLIPLYVKKAFQEDPLFSKTKVVYSLYDDDSSGVFDPEFKNKVLTDGVTKNDVAILEQSDDHAMTKLAIDSSDGFISVGGHIHPDVKEYVSASGKPVIQHRPETYIQDYSMFYDELLSITHSQS
jgi:starch synthase